MKGVFRLTLNCTEPNKNTTEWQTFKSRNVHFSSSCRVFAHLISIKYEIVAENSGRLLLITGLRLLRIKIAATELNKLPLFTIDIRRVAVCCDCDFQIVKQNATRNTSSST